MPRRAARPRWARSAVEGSRDLLRRPLRGDAGRQRHRHAAPPYFAPARKSACSPSTAGARSASRWAAQSAADRSARAAQMGARHRVRAARRVQKGRRPERLHERRGSRPWRARTPASGCARRPSGARACGGERGWKFPYGAEYVAGKCNVFREGHPAGRAPRQRGHRHTDPRLNASRSNGNRLLRKDRRHARLRQRLGDDAIYDMVGNLDRVDGSRNGHVRRRILSRGTKRPAATGAPRTTRKSTADYSTGVRCCADLPGG